MLRSFIQSFIDDILQEPKHLDLAYILGLQDIKQRYKRSVLGPLWLTISMVVMIVAMGLVFGKIFNMPLHDFFPYLAAGLILWTFISSVLSEGCMTFIDSEAIIKQLPIPYFTFILRLVWRNLLILFHNIVILPCVLLAVGRGFHVEVFLVIPGLAILLINLMWIVLILATICARYRDMPQVIQSIIQVIFYITPIMWMRQTLPGDAGKLIIEWNPLFHLIDVVRAPLLGEIPSQLSYSVTMCMAVVGWVIAIQFYRRYKHKIGYWV
jgi:ABC-type polysaccharide/polyol phosphate export permease